MKKIILFLLFILIGQMSYSQVQCGTNAGFENGNFAGWAGATGECVNVNCNTFTPTPGLVPGRHTIMTGGNDIYTCNNVPRVCPWGGPNSARLGNDNWNYETESMQYTFTVSATNPILVYAFAVVFEDPTDHADSLTPAFKSYVRSGNNNIASCSYYRVTSTNLRGTNFCPNPYYPDTIVYSNWQNVAVDLSAYVGQQVTVYFQTNDCGLGAHFGYAYVDIIGCWPKRIDISHCNQDTVATLSGPPGFDMYHWSTGDTTQSITIDPRNYTTISCVFTSVTGCSITTSVNTSTLDPIVNFNSTSVCICDNSPTVFSDSTIQNQPITSWEWDFGDNSPHSLLQNPSHHYLVPGTYTVSLTVTTNLGCRFTVTKPVRVYPCPTISLISHN